MSGFNSPEDPRKRAPRCRKCLQPMKGHRAELCRASPARSPTISPRHNNDNGYLGPNHWRSPSWGRKMDAADAAARERASFEPLLSQPASYVPTERVDEDGNTIRNGGDDDDDDDEGDEASSDSGGLRGLRARTPMVQVMDQANALRLCGDPVISIVSVAWGDLARMQATAGQSGLCTAVVKTPWAHWRIKSESQRELWVVVGKDPSVVHQMAELYHALSPGRKKERVAITTPWKQLVLASVIGGIFVILVLGLSYIRYWL
ncbi:unnamed protein product [Mycena citricolor]|uniref:Uncharacterized protein n=1 Tax=Mycena citricolor TaxID=2018698 RepID=A0AAD2GSP4_9AGAR|nr:unnamed protein product [Mycena citricolor]